LKYKNFIYADYRLKTDIKYPILKIDNYINAVDRQKLMTMMIMWDIIYFEED